jgi:hypothetical protein
VMSNLLLTYVSTLTIVSNIERTFERETINELSI